MCIMESKHGTVIVTTHFYVLHDIFYLDVKLIVVVVVVVCISDPPITLRIISFHM
jgi:hypothetical protein